MVTQRYLDFSLKTINTYRVRKEKKRSLFRSDKVKDLGMGRLSWIF